MIAPLNTMSARTPRSALIALNPAALWRSSKVARDSCTQSLNTASSVPRSPISASRNFSRSATASSTFCTQSRSTPELLAPLTIWRKASGPGIELRVARQSPLRTEEMMRLIADWLSLSAPWMARWSRIPRLPSSTSRVSIEVRKPSPVSSARRRNAASDSNVLLFSPIATRIACGCVNSRKPREYAEHVLSKC